MTWLRITLCILLCLPCLPQSIARRGAGIAAAGGGGTWAYVSHMFGNSSDHNTVTTSTGSCSGSNVIVAVVTMFGADAGTSSIISNTSTSVWHVAVDNTTSDAVAIWYTDAKALSGSETVTVTLTGSFPSIYAQCYSGGPSSGALDQTNTGIDVAGTCQVGSITPSQANTLVVVGFSGAPVSPVVSAPYTVTDTTNGGAAEGGGAAYNIQTSATATNPSVTAGNPGDCAIASFKH